MKTMKDLEFHTGIQMRFYPSYVQKRIVDKNIGAARFIYNRLVALNNEKYHLSKTAGLCPCDKARLAYVLTVLSSLKEFQNTIPFLNEDDIDAQCIANARANYQKAWDNFKKNPASGIPTFHKKGYDGSYQTNPHYYSDGRCNVRFENAHHVTLPKLGTCKVVGSKKRINMILSRHDIRFGTVTVHRDAVGRYFISIQLASDNPLVSISDNPLVSIFTKTGSMRGYDMNLDNFYTDSDGNVIDNPKYKRNLQNKLSKIQRKASRRITRAKAEGRDIYKSSNYQTARKKAALLNIKIANRRLDFQHVLSKHEVESQDFIFVEDLKTKNLLHNRKLSYAISDASWGQFHHMLEYKSRMYGKTFLKVPAHLTTQTCSECGYVLPKGHRLTLADREWTCPECGVHHDRDHNSAKNVLFRGMAILGM